MDDGSFSTTVAAEDLVTGGNEGRSRIRITDADSGEARAVFQVTGTMTLGADSVGKAGSSRFRCPTGLSDFPMR